MSDELDPAQIDDPLLRQQLVALLKLLEQALADNSWLKVKVQRLKDELTRLKGGQGRPPFKPAKELEQFNALLTRFLQAAGISPEVVQNYSN